MFATKHRKCLQQNATNHCNKTPQMFATIVLFLYNIAEESGANYGIQKKNN